MRREEGITRLRINDCFVSVEKVEKHSSFSSVLPTIAPLNEEEVIGPTLAELTRVLEDRK